MAPRMTRAEAERIFREELRAKLGDSIDKPATAEALERFKRTVEEGLERIALEEQWVPQHVVLVDTSDPFHFGVFVASDAPAAIRSGQWRDPTSTKTTG